MPRPREARVAATMTQGEVAVCTHERRLWSAFYEAKNLEWCDACQRPVYAATGRILTKQQAVKLCRRYYEVFLWFESLGTILNCEQANLGFRVLSGTGPFCSTMIWPPR